MITGVTGIIEGLGSGGIVYLKVGPITLEILSTTRAVDANFVKEKGPVSFFTHMRIVNDQPMLYGFPTFASLNLFLRLTIIKGIGPKLGLALLSALSDDALLAAIQGGDTKALTAVSGVGAGTASKIIRGFV